MGKSTASCFKIISCGGSHSVDHEDLQTPQSKGSSDRHGWSFHKRSVRHRASSNNVISEAPASASKETPESTVVNIQVQPDLTVPEKSSDVQWTEEKTELPIHLESKLSEENTELSTHLGSKLSEEKTELSTHLDSKLSEEETEVSTHLDSKLSVEKTELSTHLDSKLSQEKTKVSTHLDSKLSPEKTELSTHPDSKLSEEKTEVSTRLDSKLSVEKTELSTHLDSKLSKEKSKLSTHLDSKLLDTQASREDGITADATLDEPSIIVIQAAIRGFLAQHVLLKQKNIIKLQAVVRGHIVRRHAVGTLRCIQAIIKMQALVRARHARLLVQGSADPAKQRDRSGQRKKVAQSSGTYTYVSVEQLLSNAFARQLMEATPRTNPINIKCDPLKSDSVWKWLERWVSISSVIKEEVSNEEPQDSGAAVEQHNKSLMHSDHNNENILVPIILKSTDTESGVDASVEVTHLPEMEETNNDRDLTDLKMSSTQQPETEVKKISRKASNPAFIAAQSRFEEMSLGATSAKLSTSSSHDPGVESSLDKVLSSTDQPFRSKDIGLAENAISTAPAVQRGGSECGTELFISSTLYSPNRSEAGVNDGDMEIKASDEANHPINRENLELEANLIVVETDPSCTNTNKLERDERVNLVNGESLKSSMDNMSEKDSSHLVNKSSPEASPRSHATVSEFQATPSSQVSAKPKKSKGEKSGSDCKNRRSSADKILSNHNQDSASRSSLEQNKSGKRRNSSGSAKSDQREQEPRNSSSSNSLPSYMQATESARAKALANASPRSSPDVNDKDIYIKKRHSLPGINERQGSPRMHRSLSQAPQNASHSPQDRKWRR
ncbi:hypothetical protein ACS0TY_013650 [Phlomoides rotata]